MARSRLSQQRFSPNDLQAAGLPANRDGIRRSALDLLGYATLSDQDLARLLPEIAELPAEVLAQLRREAMYAAYEQRQKMQIDAVQKDEARSIPVGMDYSAIPGLSAELRGKLERVRPATLAQAARIEGMTPAAMALIHLRLERMKAIPRRGESA